MSRAQALILMGLQNCIYVSSQLAQFGS